MRASVLAAIYGSCATLLLVLYSVYKWLDPQTPLLIGVLGIALPVILVVAFLEKEVRPPNINVMRVAEALLIAGILGVAAPAMWTAPTVRLTALATFPSPRAIESALDDQNPRLGSAACRMMFDSRFGYDAQAATAALVERPELAASCLGQLPAGPTTDAVTTELAVMWHQILVGGDAEDCDKVAPLDNLPIAEANRASMLLDCSLQAASGETRTCCAQHVKASYPERKLLVQARMSGDNFKKMGTFGPLVAASFGEKVFMEQAGSVPALLGLQSEDYRRLSIALACEAVRDDVAEPENVRYTSWVFESHDECLSTELASEPIDVLASCEGILEMDEKERADLPSALCQARLTATEKRLAKAAKVRTGRDLGDLSVAIDSGRLTEQAGRLSAANYAELIESGDVNNLSKDERDRLNRSFLGSADRARPSADLEASARRLGEIAETPEGRQEMLDKYREELKGGSNVEAALGISESEMLDSVGEDGEISDEMKKKIEQLQGSR